MKFWERGEGGEGHGEDQQRVVGNKILGEGEVQSGSILEHHLYKSGLELTCNFVWVP